LTLVGTRHTL